MTRDEIMKMQVDELSLAVAQHIFKARTIGTDIDKQLRLLIGDRNDGYPQPLKGNWRDAPWRDSEEKAWLECPRYSEDISAAWEVESVFNQDNETRSRYMIELYVVVGLLPHLKPSLDDLYLIAHATPEQRCKAALLAVIDLPKAIEPNESA